MKTHHTTREGLSIPISEMTDSHLQNTIAAKERWWREQIRPYVRAAEQRGVKPLPLWKKTFYWVKRTIRPRERVIRHHISLPFLDDEFMGF